MRLLFVLAVVVLVGAAPTAPPTLDMMRQLTVYSYAASCRQGLNNWTCFWCTYLPNLPPVDVAVVVESNGIYGTFGYVGNSQNSIVIGYRGSESISNWIHDLDFFMTPYPGVPSVSVHEGFLSAYLQVQQTVQNTVRALRNKYPSMPILITGHSLGAALSVLCAFDLVTSGIVPSSMISVVNIGEPRVGDLAFATAFNNAIGSATRIVNQRDLVPHVPPQFFLFHHHATEIWFPTNYTGYIVCNGSGEDPNCSNSLEYWDPADHEWYLGIYAHMAQALAANCGPLKSVDDKI